MKMTSTFMRSHLYEYIFTRIMQDMNEHVTIIQDSKLITGKAAYECLADEEARKINESVRVAINYINSQNDLFIDSDLKLFLSADNIMDKRDVILKTKEKECGIDFKLYSLRANHFRLGNEGQLFNRIFNQKCRNEYLYSIKEIDDYLQRYSLLATTEKTPSDLKVDVYTRIKSIIIAEIQYTIAKDPNAAKHMIQSLLGNDDLYVINPSQKDNSVYISSYNVNGNLGPDIIQWPTKVVNSDFYDIVSNDNLANTFSIYLDKDWIIKFRIHQASSKEFTISNMKCDISFSRVPKYFEPIKLLY